MIVSVFEWSKEWNLPLNETKCTVVHYGNLSPRAQYLINGTPLSVSPSIKDLGVLMQSSLKFNDHISRIVFKARAKVNFIFKCFLSTEPEGVQRNFSKRLFIRCRIPYSPGDSPNENRAPGASRGVPQCPPASVVYRPFTNWAQFVFFVFSLSLPTLEHRRLISDILFLHKSIHGFYSCDRTNLYKLSPLARSLRRSHSLRIVFPYALPKSHSNFVTRTIDRWNVLSAEFVHSSPSNFRSHILLMEYRDELDRSNCFFVSQLEITQDYLKERALAAFEFHSQLIDANIDGGVAEFDSISQSFSSELGILIVNSEKVLERIHDRLLEKLFTSIALSENPCSFNPHEDFVRPCRAAVEAASEEWSSKLKKLENTLQNHRSEKRCKMLSEYHDTHHSPEFSSNLETMRVQFTGGIRKLTPVDETDSELLEDARLSGETAQ
ncbi:hypothetical protein PRIPAC_72377 [Pristionchus pacificus]|uniref:Uncharacterized protein n=1 Tax=Pristionchus pacificus TaxID=54126 RepID=A0A2A6C5X6_PRIPA|nr:hypothetical protein PRIPAC_72377 [Pristionchus pacificus]|eukprot:PDM73612.1 hypothetical protein PRIPAC_40968 [Pristionchus pacificus]